jgi:hypothetical protein
MNTGRLKSQDDMDADTVRVCMTSHRTEEGIDYRWRWKLNLKDGRPSIAFSVVLQ